MQFVGEKVFFFEGFTLDLRRGCLRSRNREIELRPKSFEVLRYLVEHAGRLVSKEELIQAVWPNVIVTDESLVRCVSDVRLALQDHAQRIIKTVPRRGYLLAAAVSQPAMDAGSTQSATATPLVITPASKVLVEAPPSAAAPSDSATDRRAPDEAWTELRPAERRQLTVMACELVGLAALSTQLDPEDLRNVTATSQKYCADIIIRHHGYVARCSGDGLVVYFGYPDTHEHDAENAVRAGLTLVGSAAQLGAGFGTQLQPRIGIASGVVVIGDAPVAEAVKERIAVGETPTLSARLQALAEPGQIVISQSTHRLVGGLFEYRDLGVVALNGLADPVQAWQVTGASTVQSRFEARHEATLTPLVGREEELELILRRWRQAAAGEGRVVLLSGEPGIGKSRLTLAAQGAVQDKPHARLRYYCSPHHEDSAFYPVIAQLERAAKFARSDTPDGKLDKLASVLGSPSGRESDAHLLAELLSIPTGDRYAPLSLSPQRKKEKMCAALLTQLEMLSRRRPVLMVYEDVHWIDPSSRELLDMAVELVARLPVLLLITFRPEFEPPWIGQAHVTVLSLSRLGPREGAVMIGLVAGNGGLPNEIMTKIVERADGIPLFVEELTKVVLEVGAHSRDGRRVVTAAPLPALAVPATLNALLMGRIDRLGPAAKEIAQIGGAMGREFSYELLTAVTRKSDRQLQSALGRLSDAGLVFHRGTPPQATYLFKHALVRDAAYGTLLRTQRQQLHFRIATIFEDQFPEIVAAEPALLAQHCAEAGLREKAIGYWLRAGQMAVGRSAMKEATAQLRKGLGLLGSLPDSIERQAQELDLQITLGTALIATQGYAAPVVGETFARARQLSERLPQRLVPILYGHSSFHFIRAEPKLTLQRAKEILELGEAQKDSAVKLLGWHVNTLAWFQLGDFAAARTYAERALACHEPKNRARYATLNAETYPEIFALTFLFRSLFCLGHLDQARVRRDEALAAAHGSAHAETALAIVLCMNLECELAIRLDPAMVLQHCEELKAHCAENGFPYWAAAATTFRAQCHSALGRTDEGLALQAEALAAYRATGAVSGVPAILTALADAYGMAGQPNEGLEQLDEAALLVESTEARWAEADIHRVRGELLVAVGDSVAAEASLCRAMTVARQQNGRLRELGAAMSLARIWRDQGKRAEARDLLAPIYGWFTEGFDTPVLKEAKALLEELA